MIQIKQPMELITESGTTYYQDRDGNRHEDNPENRDRNQRLINYANKQERDINANSELPNEL